MNIEIPGCQMTIEDKTIGAAIKRCDSPEIAKGLVEARNINISISFIFDIAKEHLENEFSNVEKDTDEEKLFQDIKNLINQFDEKK